MLRTLMKRHHQHTAALGNKQQQTIKLADADAPAAPSSLLLSMLLLLL
jgi:hypothetical protein